MSGALWNFIRRVSTQFLTFVVTVIMARMLTPADYGLVAMLVIFTELGVAISEGGMSQALIHTRKISDSDATAAFVYNFITSLILYGILWLCAPLIAEFYSRGATMTRLVTLMALVIPLKSVVSVRVAGLVAEMDFKRLAILESVAAIGAGVSGIWLARIMPDARAIVAYQVIAAAFAALLIWLFGGKSFRLKFSIASFRKLISFGAPLLGGNVLEVIYRNLYLPLIGKFYSASQLGIFTRARQFASLPSVSISEVGRAPAYSMLCHLQDNEEEQKRAFLRSLNLSFYLVVPIMLYLAAFAYPLVDALLGEKWLATAEILPLMCTGMIFLPMDTLNLQMVQACGHSEMFLKSELWKKLTGIAILVATLKFGVPALAAGWAVAVMVSAFISAIYCHTCSGLKISMQLKGAIAPAWFSIVAVGIARVACIPLMNPILQLCVGFAVSLAIYMLLTYFVKPDGGITLFKMLGIKL